MAAVLLLTLAVVAQNPAWPGPPDLPASELARPERMPGDPDYAPREVDGIGCAGQLELFGFTPACTPKIADAERDAGSGVRADRAWLLTRGSPRITIALLGTGVDWDDRELAGRWRLDEGELPAPEVASSAGPHDRNGDGAFTPLDYTSATGTTAPTIDRVVDARLLARPDRGDTNGNGLLDPQDLGAIFGDARDDDGDGLRDEVCGWDFAEDDADAADPPGPTGGHGARLARIAAAEANNGLAGAGACPRCTVLPLRVAGPDAARGEVYADAITWAVRAGASVIVLGTLPDYGTSALSAAIASAAERGVLVIAPAGDLGGIARTAAVAGTRALVVSALAHDTFDRREATTALAPGPTASLSLERGVSAPGANDRAAAALVGGVAGLVLAAAAGDAGAPPLDPPLSAAELAQILSGTARRDPAGWTVTLGAGRVDARGAVDAVLARAIPPLVELEAPAPGTIADPTPDLPIAIAGRVESARGTDVEWMLSSAVGVAAQADAYAALASGTAAGPAAGALPIVGVFRDPTAPPGPPLAYAITARLSASHRVGGQLVRAETERVLWAHRDVAALPGFPRAIGSPVAAHPRALDLDGDGREELLVATTDGALRWLSDAGEVTGGWPFLAHARGPRFTDAPAARSPFAATPAIAVLASGEAPSIVAVTEDGELYALDARGAVRDGFPVSLGGRAGRFHGPAVGDLDGDGVADIVVASADGTIDVVGGRGARRSGFPSHGEGPLSAPALGRDGRIYVMRGPVMEVWSIAGARLEAHTLGGVTTTIGRRPTPPGPVLGRGGQVWAAALGDGPRRDDEAVATLGPGAFGVGSAVPGTVGAMTVRPGELAVADMDGDGRADVLAGAAAASGLPLIGGWSAATGFGLTGFPLEARLASPVVFGILDLDGDGRPEAMFADDHLRVRAISAAGLSPRAWPKLMAGPLAGLVATDLLASGRWVLMAVTTEGTIHAWRTASPSGTAPLWDGPRHDQAATADLGRNTARRSATAASSSCQAVIGGSALTLLLALALALFLARWARRARGRA